MAVCSTYCAVLKTSGRPGLCPDNARGAPELAKSGWRAVFDGRHRHERGSGCLPSGLELHRGDVRRRNPAGTNGADCIFGLGDDTIRGRGGDDYVCGGDGADLIVGNNGADTLYGEGGAILLGGAGDEAARTPAPRRNIRPAADQGWRVDGLGQS